MSLIRLRRLRSDRSALNAFLAEPLGRFVSLTETWGEPAHTYELRFELPGVERLAGLEAPPPERRTGPFVLRHQHAVLLRMPAEYPFRPPEVAFTGGLFHPNVYPNGRLCWGQAEDDARWWRGGEGLDTLVERLMQITVCDPICINLASPANRDAVEPYRNHASLFPLQRLDRARDRAEPSS